MRNQKIEVENYDEETIRIFTDLYRERRESIEYVIRHGSNFEKAQATLIKKVAFSKK